MISDGTIDTATVIQGFEITNGGNVSSGGGILCQYATPRLSNLIILSNSAPQGGGIYLRTGPTKRGLIENSTIAYNSGGGIYEFDNGNSPGLTLRNLIIANNTGYTGYNTFGGGLNLENSVSTIQNCVICQNVAYEGGGAYLGGRSPTFLNSTIYCNRANIGAAFAMSTVTSTIRNCSFIDNSNTEYALYAVYSADPAITQCNFENANYSVFNSDASEQINATNNWWGAESGPYQASQNGDGQGDSANVLVSVLPFLTAPSDSAPLIPIQKLNVTHNYGDSLTLSWSPSLNAQTQGYKVFFDTDTLSFQYANSVDAGNASSLTLTGLLPGATYHIAVTAYDNSGNESWFSKSLTVKMLIPKLTLLNSLSTFPNIAVGDTAAYTFQFASQGGVPLIIDSMFTKTSRFRVLNPVAPLTISGTDTARITVAFMPDSAGSFSDTLTIVSTGGTVKASLSGNSPYPQIHVSAYGLYLGDPKVGMDTTQTLKMSNPGVNPLIVDSLKTLTKYFRVSGLALPDTVKQFDTTAAEVTFAPDSAGGFSDTLYIYTNALVSPTKVSLSGTGSSPTGIEVEHGNIPTAYALYQNYPNPFNPSTVIKYQISKNSLVVIALYDVVGRQVKTLVHKHQAPGYYAVTLDASALPSGVYFYRLDAGAYHDTKKLLLLK